MVGIVMFIGRLSLLVDAALISDTSLKAFAFLSAEDAGCPMFVPPTRRWRSWRPTQAPIHMDRFLVFVGRQERLIFAPPSVLHIKFTDGSATLLPED
jgi:hypothetical protein